MTAVAAVFLTGEVDIEVGKMRSRDMSLTIKLLAFARVQQIVTAIENDPLRIGKMQRKVVGVD